MILKFPSGFKSPVFSNPDLLSFKVLNNAAQLTVYSWFQVPDFRDSGGYLKDRERHFWKQADFREEKSLPV